MFIPSLCNYLKHTSRYDSDRLAEQKQSGMGRNRHNMINVLHICARKQPMLSCTLARSTHEGELIGLTRLILMYIQTRLKSQLLLSTKVVLVVVVSLIRYYIPTQSRISSKREWERCRAWKGSSSFPSVLTLLSLPI
jgi:hypothetical protein